MNKCSTKSPQTLEISTSTTKTRYISEGVTMIEMIFHQHRNKTWKLSLNHTYDKWFQLFYVKKKKNNNSAHDRLAILFQWNFCISRKTFTCEVNWLYEHFCIWCCFYIHQKLLQHICGEFDTKDLTNWNEKYLFSQIAKFEAIAPTERGTIFFMKIRNTFVFPLLWDGFDLEIISYHKID